MDGTDYTSLDYSGSIALVIGSEGKGIGRLVREKCDFIASMPMRGKINSLNASVAAGILMFEAAKHRN
jgi:rRNA methylase, putative, group 3